MIFSPVNIFENISPNFALKTLSVVSSAIVIILEIVFQVLSIGMKKLR